MDKLPNNFVCLTGKLSRDPKYIEGENRKPFVVLSIGTKSHYTDHESRIQYNKTVWHNSCLVFDKHITPIAKDLKKDDNVRFTGELSYRKILTRDYYSRSLASVIVLSIEKVDLS